MSASAPALVKTWSVGRYTVTLTVPQSDDGVFVGNVEWFPHLPTDLTAEEMEAYSRGRDAALAGLFASAFPQLFSDD